MKKVYFETIEYTLIVVVIICEYIQKNVPKINFICVHFVLFQANYKKSIIERSV